MLARFDSSVLDCAGPCAVWTERRADHPSRWRVPSHGPTGGMSDQPTSPAARAVAAAVWVGSFAVVLTAKIIFSLDLFCHQNQHLILGKLRMFCLIMELFKKRYCYRYRILSCHSPGVYILQYSKNPIPPPPPPQGGIKCAPHSPQVNMLACKLYD